MKPLLLCPVLVLMLAPLQTASASGVLIPRDGSPPIQVQSHRVTALVDDGLARTTVRQTFINPYSRMLEAVYVFPLPDGASLVDLAMEVGGQRLEGFLAERRAARRTYDHLVRRRKDPALVEQIGRNTFRLSVFPVLPGKPTVIELTWIQPVPLIQGEYRYVYPLALGDEASRTEQDLTATVTVRSSAPITEIHSPLEEVATTRMSAHEAIASLEKTAARLDQDIVVVAHVKSPEPSLDVHVYRPERGDAYFAAIVTPPDLADEQVIPRDVTLVLDISGSMKGVKFEQARRAGLWLVNHVRDRDRVNVILFNSTVQSFADEPVPATGKNRRRLRRFLEQAGAVGGTALGDALQRACEMPKEPGRSAMAVFLTDGLPTVGETQPEKIIAFAHAGAERGLRVFTFGVGRDAGGPLLEGIATAAGGQAELFRPDGEIESRLVRFMNRTSSPAIVDLQVKLSERRVDDLLPRPLGDIYLGEQAVITGRAGGHGKRTLVITGVLDGEPIELRAKIDLGRAARHRERQDTIARDLYASAKLAFLAQALRLRGNLSDAAYFATLDRGQYSTEDELVAALVGLSLETGVQCAYTSFIALLPEDRARLDPRDATALEKALEKAQRRRMELAGIDGDEALAAGLPGTPNETGGGRIYRGPGDIVPPSAGGGAMVPPPGDPGSAGPYPGRGPGLLLGNGGIAGPTAVSGGAARGRGARTGGFSKRSGGAGFEQWEFWWAYNREAFLDQRVPSTTETRSSRLPTALGEGATGGEAAVHGITLEQIKSRMVPALTAALGENDADVVDSAVLAIARILPASEAALVFDSVLATLGHPESSARESATLALGVLGDERARPILHDILSDTAEGRRLMTARSHASTDRPIPDMTRGLAAISLGLIHHPDDIPLLMKAIDEAPSGARDVPSCALLALGMFPDRQDEVIAYLIDVMGRDGMNRFNRALAPIALARLDRAKARLAGLAPLLDLARSDTTDNEMMRSVTIALGKLASMSDRAVLDALGAIIDHHSDAQSRHLAYIALAEIAARDPSSYDQDAKAHEMLQVRLLGEIAQPKDAARQPWAALAAGIYMRAYRSDPARAAQATTTEETLRRAFKRSRNLSHQAAMAIALGLMGARGSAPALIAALEKNHNQSLGGAIAVALGLMGDTTKADLLRDLIQRSGGDWRYRINIARALTLMHDTKSVGPLIERLGQAKTVSEIASFTQTIGILGDASAIEPLLEILGDQARSGQLRGFCAVALGLMAEKTTRPWNAAISIGLNYRAKCDALSEILDIL